MLETIPDPDRQSRALFFVLAVFGIVLLILAWLQLVAFAQPGQAVPLQRGVSVQMAVTTNAVAVPKADQQGALVVALTADGNAYLGGDPLPIPALADRVRSALSRRNDKTLYIKPDSRVPSGRLIEVIDTVRKSGVDGVTLLTAQQDASDRGKRIVPPKGLAMRMR